MIILLVGKAGSGKDTVADILVRDHAFVKIAFADPLKRICRDVYDFTDEQLWGPSSARNAPDLRYPRPPVTNWERDGHRSDMRHPQSGGKDVSRCVKCGSVVPLGDAFNAWALERCGPSHLTPRYALQQLGTEWGRDCYANTWVDLALRTAGLLLHGRADAPGVEYEYTAQTGLREGSYFKHLEGAHRPAPKRAAGVVISDGRFPNEVAAVRAAGGVVWNTVHGGGLQGAAGQHESETHKLEADAVVPDSPLEALPMIITSMLHEARSR